MLYEMKYSCTFPLHAAPAATLETSAIRLPAALEPPQTNSRNSTWRDEIWRYVFFCGSLKRHLIMRNRYTRLRFRVCGKYFWANKTDPLSAIQSVPGGPYRMRRNVVLRQFCHY